MLRTVKFNDLAQRAGATGFMKQMGVDTDASGFIANVAKWFIRLIVLVAAFDALGLPAVSDVLRIGNSHRASHFSQAIREAMSC